MLRSQALQLCLISFILFSFVTSQPSPSQQQMIKYPVTYGSLFKLYSEPTKLFIHSHEIRFGRGGIFSISGYPQDDQGNYWQILEEYPYNKKTYEDKVRCGDVIKIKSAIIGYYAKTDETSFGLTTELLPMVFGVFDSQIDTGINWNIKCMEKQPGDVLYFGDAIKLKHSSTGKYIYLDPSSAYTEYNCGRGCELLRQIQIHGVENDSEDEKTMFKILGGLTFSNQQQEIVSE